MTDLHPKESIRGDNWKRHAIGHVDGGVRHDRRFVEAELAIQDADAVRRN